ncbi:sulfate ABC transporter ATP-binding protein [Nocardia elegans]|uniref:sulfate/molybdate ABC transporter ATP-binding protein n=1 Tax=Nocardia elegans TaxID=300029 RepID=UPI0018932850|nr:sulfate ABC transporter ATP-binding protein [Nocardia elegans]MBF6246795.1 sulfate ABC transporter ATP-binding protein [Nocardia elegans]
MITVTNARKNYGNFAALDDVTIEIPSGELTALLGPSGSGKSTLLRSIAGLEALDDGVVVIAGKDVTRVAPQKRDIGFVFQHYAAFKHMTVRDNVAFGLKIRKRPKAEITKRVDELLGIVGLDGFQHRYPAQLSGGQRQRMALARALAVDPQVLLLDEPFGALDAKVRADLRTWLRRLHEEVHVTTVLVTHDPLDAMVLADRLVILEHGRMVQQGPPAEVARRPRSDYVAHLVGLNLYRGTAHGTSVAVDGGGSFTTVEPGTGPVHLAFPPNAVGLHPERPAGSPRNTWPVVVSAVEQHAHTVRVRLDGAPPVLADVTPAALAELDLTPGARLWAAVKATETHVYPA